MEFRLHRELVLVAGTLPAPADVDRGARGIDQLVEAASKTDDPHTAEYIEHVVRDAGAVRLLSAIFGNSPFLAQNFRTAPEMAMRLLESGPRQVFEAALDRMRRGAREATSQDVLMRTLRHSKRDAATALAVCDIAGLQNDAEITNAMTRLAESAVSAAVGWLLTDQAAAIGVTLPQPEDPARGSGYIVLGMGKLGGQELNYSSDIDLIVLSDAAHSAFRNGDDLRNIFVELTKRLVTILDKRTVDGYVFRTDLRLRPDPGATPIAVSVDMAESYYESAGQNWERAAMIKARPIAGDLAAGDAFLARLAAYIWRKNLDFPAIEDIHAVKRQIHSHYGGAAIAIEGHNVKLGRGGIREIEFFAQTQQLIWGGKRPSLRCRATCNALDALADEDLISPIVATEMKAAYWFLRRLEHRLQMVEDQQTHTLPNDPEKLDGVAIFMGLESTSAFRETLSGHLHNVERHYAALFEDEPDNDAPGNLVFTGVDNDPETLETLRAFGFTEPVGVSAAIRGWHRGGTRATYTARAREILTQLTPELLRALGRTVQPNIAFHHFDGFLRGLSAGVPILSLFRAHPELLKLVAEIMGSAPRLASALSRTPHLFDAMLSPEFDAPFPDTATLGEEIDRLIRTAGHEEAALDAARRWTSDRAFQAGVHLLRGSRDHADISRYLSAAADAVLIALQQRVERDFAERHGVVPGGEAAIVAFGKLGGQEMSFGSDLDLVFIYDAGEDADNSDGDRPLAVGTYFARLAQRLINAVSAQTSEGRLYETDMRLRPSGNAGPIASAIEAFGRYYDQQAWTWEHMALTRARLIYAPEGGTLAGAIEHAIRRTLCAPRDPDQLLADVADMRARIDAEHGTADRWQIKYVRGGLVDIEFITQYLQLLRAHDAPGILSNQTGVAITLLADHGFLSAEDAGVLTGTLTLCQTVQGFLRLTTGGLLDEQTAPDGLLRGLARATGDSDFAALEDRIASQTSAVHQIFNRLIKAPADKLKNTTTKETTP